MRVAILEVEDAAVMTGLAINQPLLTLGFKGF